MNKTTCEMCDMTGVIFNEETGVAYCQCDYGQDKEFADMKSNLVTKFTTF